MRLASTAADSNTLPVVHVATKLTGVSTTLERLGLRQLLPFIAVYFTECVRVSRVCVR